MATKTPAQIFSPKQREAARTWADDYQIIAGSADDDVIVGNLSREDLLVVLHDAMTKVEWASDRADDVANVLATVGNCNVDPPPPDEET